METHARRFILLFIDNIAWSLKKWVLVQLDCQDAMWRYLILMVLSLLVCPFHCYSLLCSMCLIPSTKDFGNMALFIGMIFTNTWSHFLSCQQTGWSSNMSPTNSNVEHHVPWELRLWNQETMFCFPLVSNHHILASHLLSSLWQLVNQLVLVWSQSPY